jgi:hypothetical protein
MISAKIDVTKIDKSLLYKGAKGTYLDITLIENREGTDQYGNDGFIAQSVSKEAREAGEKGPIIGNYRNIQTKAKAAPVKAAPATSQDDIDDDIPF